MARSISLTVLRLMGLCIILPAPRENHQNRRLARMTSSPKRVWAAAEARVSEKMMASNADWASLVKSTPLD
jgi:hypothetical protein